MEPVDVFIDTEVLVADPYRRRGAFRAVERLAVAEVLRIHLSEVSVGEFLSGLEARVNEARDKAMAGLRGLSRLCRSSGRKDCVDSRIQRCHELAEEEIAGARELFRDWLVRVAAHVHSLQADHSERVFNSYFSGAPPFSRQKSRADIPDAFIWQSVLDLAASERRVVVVSSDKALKKACASELDLNISHCSTLEELLQTDRLAGILKKDLLETQLSIAEELFADWAAKSGTVKEFLSGELLGREVFFFYPAAADYAVQQVSSIDCLMTEGAARYYGDGFLSFSFSGRARCEVSASFSSAGLRASSSAVLDYVDSADQETAEIRLRRTLVFAGSLLVAVEESVLGSPVPAEVVLDALLEAETAIDSFRVHWESGGGGLVHGIFDRHAHHEAYAQLKDGDMEVALDEEEEAARAARARWHDFPDGIRQAFNEGDDSSFSIGEGARIKIAPIPRLEQWVRIIKKSIITEAIGDEDVHESKTEEE